ncbi:MAG: zinc ribbon domain-containing protein [Nitrospinota bacterium]|nr:zinc ribbon domain-containing protein [Nitrospinota bacterium]MDH5677265.1 zinc ribbon domain-containing protein [Nitrospinota bacterium]
MKCPKCGFSQQDGGAECVKCGVIFSRIKPKIARRAKGDGAASWTDQLEVDGASGIPPIPKVETMAGAGAESLGWEEKKEFARRFLLEELIDLPPWAHYARGALLAVMLWGTVKLTFTSNIPLLVNTMQFMHLINLVFHEAGHIIFTPFGRFIQVLGGSLLQTLIPLVCLGGFLLVWRDPFAASVAWWWTGENLVDLAPYIYDARAGDMMLLGGMTGRDNPDIHDWKNLLTWTGLLKYDHLLASLAYYTGLLMMFSALLWGGLVVYRGLTTKEDM